jgi:hypothetical protein
MTPKGSSFAFAESKDDRPKCPLENQHGTLQDQTIQTISKLDLQTMTPGFETIETIHFLRVHISFPAFYRYSGVDLSIFQPSSDLGYQQWHLPADPGCRWGC